MKLTGRQPRLMPDVMQAIVDLKECTGSTQVKILEYIQSAISAKKIMPRPRNVTMQVRRALKHGIESGLLTQRGGKFQLGIKPKDFAVYKIFRHMEPLTGCNKCKKKGGRKGRRKRRRRRRRSMGEKQSDTDISTRGTPEPMDAGRRRRSRRRRGRPRSLLRDSPGFSDNEPDAESRISSKELMCRRCNLDPDNDHNLINRKSSDFPGSYIN